MCKSMFLVFTVITLISGCAANIGVPQSRSEFIKAMKDGGIFTTVEKKTVNKPFNAVYADVKKYSEKCLDVTTTRSANYSMKEVGGSTTYHPKMEKISTAKGVLSLQAEYGAKRANSGAPDGGLYVFAAEIVQGSNNKSTELTVYHQARGDIAKFMYNWVEGDKASCPTLQ